MFRTLVLLALTAHASPSLAAPSWTVGTGLETRFQKEVNPDYAEMKAIGQLFAQANFGVWAGHAELGHEVQESNSGALSITSKSLNFGLWGRYQFLTDQYRPFVSTGLGSYFDTVTTRFGASEDERTGTRPYWGLGGGISAVFWEHLLVEVEGRGALIRDRKEPTLAALFRAGFYY